MTQVSGSQSRYFAFISYKREFSLMDQLILTFTKSLALFALLKIFCYLCGSKTEIFNIWLTKQ